MMTSGPGSWERGRRRRRWSDEDKVRIVAECEAPGSSISLVARRHDLNANLLFSWRRRLRAYGNRDAAYDCFPVAVWETPAEDEHHIAWPRAFWQAMRPFATGGVYANNLGKEGEERVRAAYGGLVRCSEATQY